MIGICTLFYKELLRFWKVSFQTITAPVITALLYLVIFGNALITRVNVFPGVSYLSFLVPGLIMMSILQNAFANCSSSLIQSKITGNLLFVLLAPFGSFSLFFGYVFASVFRGLCVGSVMFLSTIWFVETPIFSISCIILFSILGSLFMASFGMVAGVVSEKFDHLAFFQSVLVMPLTFLAGTFYSTQALPAIARHASYLNPVFYMVDGFRYGFFGKSDMPFLTSLMVVAFACLSMICVNLLLLASGYKIRQ